MSSYEWGGVDDARGPPAENGNTLAVFGDGTSDCGKGRWICEHRHPYVKKMIGFRKRAAERQAQQVSHWWDNDYAVAFSLDSSRGGFGHVAINSSAGPINVELPTSLKDGAYCDIVSRNCSKYIVKNGRLQITLPPYGLVVLENQT